ncbi:hypothetical protein UCDDS831_g01810 [Diplodia seriata]|uniref:Uncharacterized protein n=1 Tax=Diplodia seriata TaxID=420778 RepID=A0A0G2EV33_9PEZI|nr:hypothetical protein UCDDS831_g01810 [Diplodia seriata]
MSTPNANNILQQLISCADVRRDNTLSDPPPGPEVNVPIFEPTCPSPHYHQRRMGGATAEYPQQQSSLVVAPPHLQNTVADSSPRESSDLVSSPHPQSLYASHTNPFGQQVWTAAALPKQQTQTQTEAPNNKRKFDEMATPDGTPTAEATPFNQAARPIIIPVHPRRKRKGETDESYENAMAEVRATMPIETLIEMRHIAYAIAHPPDSAFLPCKLVRSFLRQMFPAHFRDDKIIIKVSSPVNAMGRERLNVSEEMWASMTSADVTTRPAMPLEIARRQAVRCDESHSLKDHAPPGTLTLTCVDCPQENYFDGSRNGSAGPYQMCQACIATHDAALELRGEDRLVGMVRGAYLHRLCDGCMLQCCGIAKEGGEEAEEKLCNCGWAVPRCFQHRRAHLAAMDESVLQRDEWVDATIKKADVLHDPLPGGVDTTPLVPAPAPAAEEKEKENENENEEHVDGEQQTQEPVDDKYYADLLRALPGYVPAPAPAAAEEEDCVDGEKQKQTQTPAVDGGGLRPACARCFHNKATTGVPCAWSCYVCLKVFVLPAGVVPTWFPRLLEPLAEMDMDMDMGMDMGKGNEMEMEKENEKENEEKNRDDDGDENHDNDGYEHRDDNGDEDGYENRDKDGDMNVD